jgi:type II secretory pathway component PulF
MIKSGEESNQLVENIDFSLQVLEQELEERQDRFVASIEPVMLLAIGGIVLLLVLNLYFPIFQMINSIDVINTI